MEIPRDIASIIESLTCPVYKKHPKIIYDKNGEFHIECCCPQFKKQCLYLIKKLLMLSAKEK
jgi:hypothetical protein